MELDTLEVGTVEEWRSWLRMHHRKKQEIWLVFYRQGFRGATISYSEALDEALAYGWIDSLVRRLDQKRYARKFTPRRPGSVWSSINLDRVKRLTSQGRMTRWGLEAYGKRSGQLSLLEKFNAEGYTRPRNLESALRKSSIAWNNYQKFSPSYRKRYAMWISAAKRPETRKKRIEEAVYLISRNVKNLLK